MKFAVRYYTKSGNTKKLADAIAEELGVTAQDVSKPLEEKADVLVICNSLYWAGVDSRVKKFLKENKAKIGCMVNASTAALAESTYSQMGKIAKAEGFQLSAKEFHCRGQFASVHKGHPDAEDLRNAKAFAKKLKEEN